MNTKEKKSSILVELGYLAAKLLLVYFLIVAVVTTFRRAGATHNDTEILKTVGFWGICVIVFILDMVFIGAAKIKRHGPVITINFLGALVCWIIYGLMFAK